MGTPSMPVRVRPPPPTLLSGKHLALRSDDPFRWIAAPGWRMMLHSWGANGAHSGVRGGRGGGGRNAVSRRFSPGAAPRGAAGDYHTVELRDGRPPRGRAAGWRPSGD